MEWRKIKKLSYLDIEPDYIDLTLEELRKRQKQLEEEDKQLTDWLELDYG